MLKSRMILISSLIIGCITLMTSMNTVTANASGQSKAISSDNNENYGQKIIKTYNINGKKIIDKDSKISIQAINDKVETQLTNLGFSYKDIKEAKLIHDNYYDKDKYILDMGDEKVELNSNFELEQVSNKINKNSIVQSELNGKLDIVNPVKKMTKIADKAETGTVIEKVKKALNIGNDYKLVQNEPFDDDMWVFTFEKELRSNLLNPYESIKVIVNRDDSSIQTTKIFNEKPNTIENKISSKEAINISKKIISKYGSMEDVKTSLEIFKPNYYWTKGEGQVADFVSLCWLVRDEHVRVYVDAVTGEVVGGDWLKSTDAKAFGCDCAPHDYNSAKLAEAGFAKLGYNTQSTFTGFKYMRDPILQYLNSSSAYGFYITCHGNPTLLSNIQTTPTDPGDWRISTSDIHGNFYLVYLDACQTAATHDWANAFHCDQQKRGFLGWRTDVWSNNTYAFNQYFWPNVGAENLYYLALDAANSVPGSGTTPIVYIGDKTWWGWAY